MIEIEPKDTRPVPQVTDVLSYLHRQPVAEIPAWLRDLLRKPKGSAATDKTKRGDA